MGTARTRANRKYNEKAYDRLYVTVPKGKKAEIESRAKETGHDSINSYVNNLIAKDIGRRK